MALVIRDGRISLDCSVHGHVAWVEYLHAAKVATLKHDRAGHGFQGTVREYLGFGQ